MCGIAGLFLFEQNNEGLTKIRDMISLLRHRGPDDEGYVSINTENGNYKEWCGKNSSRFIKDRFLDINLLKDNFNLAFGHTRLSIIDLSVRAHQPMTNEDGSIWITYNGEIYNYIELREVLKASNYKFKSDSDSEVIIHAYEEWGIKCLEKFNGMFAFAIWDQRKKRLFCARDRFGIKPFYYLINNDTFGFASEIKSILPLMELKPTANFHTMYHFLLYGKRNLNEDTFFDGINQLKPAHYLLFQDKKLSINSYWDLPQHTDYNKDETEAVKDFSNYFDSAIKRHLRSDVDIGFCLSGGLDSSCIVSSAYEKLNSKLNVGLHSFSAVFNEKKYDERFFIEKLVKDKKIVTHYIFPSAEQFIKEYENIIWYQDEPFAKLSVFAQYLVMKLASQNGIKVLLDGQGGDESLAGYNTFWVPRIMDLLSSLKISKLNNEIKYAAEIQNTAKLTMIRTAIRSMFFESPIFSSNPFQTLFNLNGYSTDIRNSHPKWLNKIEYVNQHSYKELRYNQLSQLLHYEDRNSMTFGIESRVPFLDLDLVETVFRFPGKLKISNGTTKYVLRKAFASTLPNEIIQRKDKLGFVTPGEDIWLQGEMKDWAWDILLSIKFRDRNIWNSKDIIKTYQSYLEGNVYYGNIIFRILITELWFRKFID